MALTEDRLRTADVGTSVDDLYRGRAQERDEPLALGERLRGQRAKHPTARPEADLFTRWSHRLLAAWGIVLTPLMLLAPAPDDPDAALSSGALLVTSAFTVGLVATLAGLGRSASWGFKASGCAAALGVTFGLACAATGHHGGSWWAVESIAFGALLALTAVARGKASPGGSLGR